MQVRFRRIAVLAALLAVAAGFGPAPRSAHAAGASIKAVVNGEPITTNEVSERARLLSLSSRMSGPALERAALEELIDDKLKIQEGKRVGVEIPDAQVEAAFGSIAQRMKITPAQLAAGLGSRGVGAAGLKSRIRTQMLWQQLVMGRFNRSVNISDSAIVDALTKKQGSKEAAQQVGKDGKTAEYNLQQVVIVVPQGAGADARMKEAEALRAKVTSCDMLPAAVKAINEASVKPFGKRTEDELPENFRGLLADVPVGHLSKPQRGPIGIEMVAVCEKRDLAGDFQVRSKVEEELRAQEGEIFARRYVNDLRRVAVIDYRK